MHVQQHSGQLANNLYKILKARSEQDDGRPNKPERNLIAAVFQTLLHDLTTGDNQWRGKALGLIKNKKAKRPFSFNWMCQSLDLDTETVRQILLTGNFKYVPQSNLRKPYKKRKAIAVSV